MSVKVFSRVEIKDEDKGEVTALFSTLSVIDSDLDVTRPGAFEDGAKAVISAYGHMSWSGMLPVGSGKIRTTKTEAILDGQFFMDTVTGADTFTTVKRLAKDGLGEWSYGYDPVEYSFGEHEGQRVRFLDKLKVHEVSPVLLGAGVNTRTLAAKSAGLRFGEHLSSVVAEVRAARLRAADVVAMRQAKGKTLAGDSLAVLAELLDEAKALAELLEMKADEHQDDEDAAAAVSVQAAALQREFLRFQAHRLAG